MESKTNELVDLHQLAGGGGNIDGIRRRAAIREIEADVIGRTGGFPIQSILMIANSVIDIEQAMGIIIKI